MSAAVACARCVRDGGGGAWGRDSGDGSPLFFLALVATVLYAFFSTGIYSLVVLMIPPPFLAVGYGVLLLWGLPLWRRLYLKQSRAAALVLAVIGILFFLICQYSFFVWVIASGAAEISP